jgi:tyrosine-protein phosphatase YwqE
MDEQRCLIERDVMSADKFELGRVYEHIEKGMLMYVCGRSIDGMIGEEYRELSNRFLVGDMSNGFCKIDHHGQHFRRYWKELPEDEGHQRWMEVVEARDSL